MIGTTNNVALDGSASQPRPADAKRIKVHNADLYLDLLHNSDWTSSENCAEPSQNMKKLHEARMYAASQPGKKRNSGGGGSGSPRSPRKLPDITTMSKAKIQSELIATERANRQRDAFLQKQLVREEETKVRLEQSMRDTQRKAKERAAQREAEFDARCTEFCDANSAMIDEMNTVVAEDDAWHQRKRERLYAEWSEQVFNPMQSQIDAQLSVMSHADITQKRRYMFQCFLDEANRKRGGVFRDIILECDYDPLTMAKETTLTYSSVPITDDPVKDRFTREGGNKTLRALREMSSVEEPGVAVASSTVGGAGRSGLLLSATSSHGGAAPSLGCTSGPCPMGLGAARDATLPVKIWDRIEVTPYGRYAPEGRLANQQKPNFNRSDVVMNHYKVPTKQETTDLLNVELPSKGKRVYDKPPSQVF